MSDYTAMAEVGESLVDVLWEEIQADPQVNALIDNKNRISLDSPANLANDNAVRLSVYLYRVTEDPYMKNQFPVSGTGTRLRKPPLTLDLFYLITPMLGPPREQQIVLGKVMQVLYDRALLEGSDLVGSLATPPEALRVILNPVDLADWSLVWYALGQSFRLSVCYQVRVTLLDSRTERPTQPVVQRTAQYEGA